MILLLLSEEEYNEASSGLLQHHLLTRVVTNNKYYHNDTLTQYLAITIVFIPEVKQTFLKIILLVMISKTGITYGRVQREKKNRWNFPWGAEWSGPILIFLSYH